MTINRNIEADKKETSKVLQAINKGKFTAMNSEGISWLEHEGAGGQLDQLLAYGATMDQLKTIRKTVNNHFSHLKKEHGLQVLNVNGVYRVVVPKD